MSRKNKPKEIPWYLNPDLQPIHEWGDGQEIKQTFARRNVIELEDGEALETEGDY
jgi:hypothetical protein